jgi:hypothetical protein
MHLPHANNQHILKIFKFRNLFYQNSWDLPVTVCSLFSVMFPFSNHCSSQ